MTETLPAVEQTTRAVVRNQLLWTAGYTLTSGGFLTFFGAELGATGFLISLLLATPEIAAATGILTRPILRRIQNRKRTWLWFSLFAKLVACGIPLLAFPGLRPAGKPGIYLLLALVVVVSALQSVAYLAYISWLSDLVPEVRWGTFFAKRNIAKQSILLLLPVAGGFLRDWWKREFPEEIILWAYLICFSLGILLQLGSLIPLLKLPEVGSGKIVQEVSTVAILKAGWSNTSLRYLWLHNWSLAFFNGLTQAAFFFYSIGPLGIGLGTYYVLHNLMVLVKIPVSQLAGTQCDQNREKRLLIVSLLIASSGVWFWLPAGKETWWLLVGAYLLWGSYAAANLAGRNLLLKLAPPGDNTSHLAMFRLLGGLFAGLSGILGGLWLDELRKTGTTFTLGTWEIGSFQMIFLASLVGRYLSILWLIPVRSTVQNHQTVQQPEVC